MCQDLYDRERDIVYLTMGQLAAIVKPAQFAYRWLGAVFDPAGCLCPLDLERTLAPRQLVRSVETDPLHLELLPLDTAKGTPLAPTGVDLGEHLGALRQATVVGGRVWMDGRPLDQELVWQIRLGDELIAAGVLPVSTDKGAQDAALIVTTDEGRLQRIAQVGCGNRDAAARELGAVDVQESPSSRGILATG